MLEKNIPAVGKTSNKWETKKTVGLTLVGHTCKKCNVVVTGFQEFDDEDGDSLAVTNIGETHSASNQASYLTDDAYAWASLLSTNQDAFLWNYKSENTAGSILRASKDLGKSDEDFVKENIYIIRDVASAERKLIFKQRCKRRAKLDSDVETSLLTVKREHC